ncbi:MAG: hypothetical protein M1331_01040 [Candidatus Marsarchaeota archaeon]|nr:hypothetical protein [Candidatus Marsarchaeota archaeon]MCL5105969.1 hypothetical protein [Candidatus Marsarchaeota archaeon]
MKKIFKISLMLIIAMVLLAAAHASILSPASSSQPGCSTLPASIQSIVAGTEPWYCPINAQIGAVFEKYASLMWIAVLISFAIAGTIYMGGALAGSSRIKNFGIAELYEATATGVIVGIFLYVCAVVFGILPGITVGPINPYATALHYITQVISQAQSLYASLFFIYFKIQYYFSYSLTVGGTVSVLEGIAKILASIGGGENIALAIGKFAISFLYLDPSMALMNIISDGIMLLWAEYYLIVFFAVAAIPVFLIPGVVFRAIIPTRALGGMLMAIAITFYLIVPTMFAVAFYFTAPNALHQMNTAATLLNKFGAGQGSITNALTPASPLVVQLKNAQNAMAGFWLMLLFYPVLIIAVAYAAITQLAAFLGGVAKVGGRMRSFI